MTATVTVRGEATAPAAPDEAQLVLAVSALAQTPDAALADVAARSSALDDALDELGVDRDQRTTSGVSLGEDWDYQRDRRVFRGHRASRQLVVRLQDQSRIGPVMTAAVERAQAKVHGPSWQIAPDNPAHDDARRAAAQDARRRAQAYADALGVRLGAVVAVREPGLRHEPLVATMALAEASDAPRHVDVSSGELEVDAAVEVTFALDQ